MKTKRKLFPPKCYYDLCKRFQMNSHTVSIQPQIAQHTFIFSIESETAQVFALHTKDRMRSFRVRPLHASRNTSRKPKRGTMLVHALRVMKCRNLS